MGTHPIFESDFDCLTEKMEQEENNFANVIADQSLPTVEERLASLRPSRQLLEFYRRKVDELESEHDSLSVKLDGYSKICEHEAQLERTIRQREKEIADLQKALSDLQVFLLKEREQNLRLFAENDKLRIRELEDRKTMQHLLTIAGPAVAECSYFHKEPPNIIVIPEHNAAQKYGTTDSVHLSDSGCMTGEFEPRPPVLPSSKGGGAGQRQGAAHLSFANFRVENKKSKGPSQERINDDKQILALQTEALRAQLEESIKLSGEQVSQLMEDRRIMLEEHETLRKRDAERNEQLEARLRKTQELLRDSTKDFLEARKGQREKERQWLQERDKLLQQLDKAHDRIYEDEEAKSPTKKLLKPPTSLKRDFTILSKPTIDPELVKKIKSENSMLKERLEQAVHLSDMYREQCINAEEELSTVRDQIAQNQTVFQQRTSKLVDKLELTTKRYGALEQRRGLEIEGYNTEIRKLKTRCDQLESQLFKISVGGLDDVEVLQNFKESAARSRALQNQIKSIKKKLYEVESNFRHQT